MELQSDHQGFRTTALQGDTAFIHAASTSDIDEQAALLRGWNQTYEQISAGRFNGSFLETQIDCVQLFREVTSNSLQQTGALPEGTIAVGAPVLLQGNATFCGRLCDGQQLHVFSGKDQFEFFSPRGLDIVGFVLDEQDLRSALTSDELDDVMPSLARPHLRFADIGALNRMRTIFLDVCEIVAEPDASARDRVRLSSMSRDLIAAIVGGLAHGYGDRFDVPQAKRALIVRDARDVISEWSQDIKCIADLCRELGVSRRALQQSFQDTLGVKPSAYMRAVRMNGARRAIKTENSVAEAATLWGFWHFGRFARDYNMMFGELPSEAFRRHHGAGEQAPRCGERDCASR
jgi:AraC family ethanolamine operon transcriptional activator